MEGAAGTSQQGVEVEDIAEVLKDSGRSCDPLKLLICIQGTLFSRFTFCVCEREREREEIIHNTLTQVHENYTNRHEVHMPP